MPQRSIPPPEKAQSAPSQNRNVVRWDASGRWGRWLDSVIFFFLCLFAILLPHSIKGSQHAWQIAFLLWLLKLAIERRRPFPQPLTAPLLAYVVLSAISTLLSPDPYLSWVQMKFVCLIVVGILVAQNLNSMSQVRTLVFLLVLSGFAAAVFTAWQYSYGIGVKVKQVLPETPAYQAGLRSDDIITAVDGHAVYTAAQLERRIDRSPTGSILRVDFLRGLPYHRWHTFLGRESFRPNGPGANLTEFVRAKPVRAQGTLGHYGIFAETLMPIGCMAWAMMLSTKPQRPALRALLAIIFVALAATILATQTRAAIAGLAVGCFAALLLLAGKRTRMWGIGLLGGFILVATLWIQHSRGLGWIGAHDAGTHYRTLMWQDGLRLVRQHPWFGVGMGTITNHWEEWNIRAYALYHVQYHFHSDPVQLAVERGLPTLAAWLWFLVANFIFLFRLFRRTRESSRFAAGVVAGVFAGFVAFLVPSLVEYSLNDETLVMLLFFYFGMAVAIDRMSKIPGAIEAQE